MHAGARVIHRPSLHDGLRLNGYPRRVVICYVSPPGTLWSALYDRAGIEKKTAAPAEAVAQLHKAAERTGLFEPTGTGQSLKCVIDHPFTEVETNALVVWCESVAQAIREYVVPGGQPSG